MQTSEQEQWKTALKTLQEMKVINEYVMQEVTETGKSRYYLQKNAGIEAAINWLLEVRLNMVQEMLDDLRVKLAFAAEGAETEEERKIGRAAAKLVDTWGAEYEAREETATKVLLENTIEFYEEVVARIRAEKAERDRKREEERR
jgi:hypothetical protein